MSENNSNFRKAMMVMQGGSDNANEPLQHKMALAKAQVMENTGINPLTHYRASREIKEAEREASMRNLKLIVDYQSRITQAQVETQYDKAMAGITQMRREHLRAHLEANMHSDERLIETISGTETEEKLQEGINHTADLVDQGKLSSTIGLKRVEKLMELQQMVVDVRTSAAEKMIGQSYDNLSVNKREDK